MLRAGARLLLLGAPACAAVVVQGKTVDGTSKDDVRCLCQNKPLISLAAGGDDKGQAADGKDDKIQPAALNFFNRKYSCWGARALTGGDCRRVDLAVIQKRYNELCLQPLQPPAHFPTGFVNEIVLQEETLASFEPGEEFWEKKQGARKHGSLDPLVLLFAEKETLQKARAAVFGEAWSKVKTLDDAAKLVEEPEEPEEPEEANPYDDFFDYVSNSNSVLEAATKKYRRWSAFCGCPQTCGEIPAIKKACDSWLEPIKKKMEEEEQKQKAAQEKKKKMEEEEWTKSDKKEQEEIRRRHEENKELAKHLADGKVNA